MEEAKTLVCDVDVIHADVVAEVRDAMPGEDIVFDVADFFKVLGDSTRVGILSALRLHEMCVCDLAVLLNMTKSAISHQLRTLRHTKLVKFRREGKNVFYSLNDQHINDILEIAAEHLREL